MKVVCDTSVIITLHRGEIIDCLEQLFTGVLVPPAVEAECRRPSTRKALLDSGIDDKR